MPNVTVTYIVRSGIVDKLSECENDRGFVVFVRSTLSLAIDTENKVLMSDDGYYVTKDEWDELKSIIDAGYADTSDSRILEYNSERYVSKCEEAKTGVQDRFYDR